MQLYFLRYTVSEVREKENEFEQKCINSHACYYRQDAAKRQPAGIVFTQ